MGTPTMTPAEIEALEAMIDRCGMSRVIAGLAEVSEAKADHIRSAWQDRALAKRWDRFAARLDRLSDDALGEI